jgi:lysophospholipase L1-like esterase
VLASVCREISDDPRRADGFRYHATSFDFGGETMTLGLSRQLRFPAIFTAALMVSLGNAAFAADPAKEPAVRPIKIVLVGDSTVNDGGGWGLGFKKHLAPEARCVNLAQNGRSSKSFIDEGWWKKALDEKPDYVFIQFGHNDQPGKGPKRETDPKTTYPELIGKYVDEAKAIGAKPIIVTSLARRNYKDGKVTDTLEPYAEAAKKVAAEKKVPVIDLHAISMALLNKMGPEEAKKFDPAPKANAEVKGPDHTHLSPAGQAYFGAVMAKEARATVSELAPYIDEKTLSAK